MTIYKDIIKTLQESTYKLTPQREVIVKVLVENSKEHLSAEELYFILKEVNPDIGLATVYRTLDIFYDLNILEKITFGNGIAKYHLRQKVTPGMHHHLICTCCHGVQTVQNPIFNKLIAYVDKEYGFATQDNTIAIYGTCSKCREEQGS
ncbi:MULTISPECIES: Fur family transcriptional regulator [unclassified Gemella]|uniref:Fur family transcriptional regulator n=1 Tax=unclassified Gemella TaxID=2624949 RepID=UPI001C03E2A1|nr:MULTISPECIES: Fur family transcriptional regulator [unclassified Gemella]MBU0278784.1 transcriptional repressor [Gemella sp. zg-1178]QWQ38722.1 transcriptional repressor [Gemella sp. zg-570]